MSQKFVSYDLTGNITGFYDSIDSPIPPGLLFIPISHAEWLDLIHAPYGDYKIINKLITKIEPETIKLSIEEQAKHALNSHVIVECKSHPELSGNYAIDGNVQRKLFHILNFLTDTFPHNKGKFPWKDIDGKIHIFNSVDMFRKFADEIFNHVLLLEYIEAGLSSKKIPEKIIL